MSRQFRASDVILKGRGDFDVSLLDDGDVQGLDAEETSLGWSDEKSDCFRVSIKTLYLREDGQIENLKN